MKKKKNKTKSSSSNQINGSDSSTFHVSIASTAVAQICHSAGYKATQTTALQTLTNITVRYLTSLATSAANSAASTGRTECNLYDVIRALDDVHADVGFKGNSAVTKRLEDSEMLKEMVRFVRWSREIPFAKPLQMLTSSCEKRVFTAVNEGKSEGVKQMVTSRYGESDGNEELNDVCKKSYCGEKEMPRGRQMVMSHVPKWLPEFPKKSECGEKVVFTQGKSEKEKVNYYYKEVSELPVVRKKVRFEIGGKSGRDKDVTNLKFGVDLRSGVCKGGKRILCHIYEDGKKYVNDDGGKKIRKGDIDVVKKSMVKKMKSARKIKS